MTVIDIDTHWEIGEQPGSHPLEPWREQFPTGVDRLAFAISGDLVASLPPERRPSPKELMASLVSLAKARGGPVILHPQHESTAAERVAWMDEVGIEHCIVNPGGYWQMLQFLAPADRPAGAARCNDFLAEQLADRADRLHGAAVIDFTDLHAAAAELARARARGHRKFFLTTIEGKPSSSTPPGHPAWDVVWSAAVDLGMIASIHVGNTAASFDGWADIGWDLPGGAGVANLNRLANTKRTHAAQDLLCSLLYGGVFARHPNLTVTLEEVKTGWIPAFVAECTRQAMGSVALGDWPWETSGGDMLRRNVRFTPLIGFGDDAMAAIRALPEMATFSSDYPHQEGNADPLNLYGSSLDELSAPQREAFLGGTMRDAFARTGQPL